MRNFFTYLLTYFIV